MWGQQFLEFISKDATTYVGGISITTLFMGAIFFTSKLITNSFVNSKFNKNLENHKSDLMKINDQYRKELNKELEETKSDFMKINDKYKQELNADIERLKHQQQRTYKDFELYTSKKHERYPELYKNIEIAYGAILSLHGYYRDISFENTNKEDVMEYLKELRITKMDINEVDSLWPDDQSSPNQHVIKKVNSIRTLIKRNEAHEKWSEANDTLIFNELYLSEEVALQCRKLLNAMWDYLEAIEIGFEFLVGENASTIRKELQDDKNKLKILMKAELAEALKRKE
ncbi:hypothetical protein [Paenibacillus sp. OAE614]|uniref:hypothetical protein n=1 Tax=Paenibacillus sp. OAE614 TaxID=2663804 RepID=UPI00178B5BB8